MRKMFLALSVALAMVLSGCKDMMLNGNMREYLEFYTTTALLSKHDVQTESYTDQAGNLTVPSHQDAVVNLYTSNPKSFTLIPQFTATFSNGVTLDSGLDSYGLTVEQHPSDLTRYTATIPSKLLEELDLKGSGITLTVTPMEVVSQRTMPEYTFTLRSNTKPAFGGAAAVIMQTSDVVDGSKKWVLCFELPDLSGIHKDIVTVEINGKKYAVDASAGQGAAALASMGSKLTTTDKIQVKDDGGVFFRPDVSDNGVYFITDDTIGTTKTYTVRLVDSAGLVATLPPVSTADTVYGKEIVSFVFEASKNPQIASLSNGDLTGTISGTNISFNVPATLTDKSLTPTITLSGGTVNPAGDTLQDFSQPVTYTVTAGDGTTTSYTVSLNQFLPEPRLTPLVESVGNTYTLDYPTTELTMTVDTTALPSGTVLSYNLNGQELTLDLSKQSFFSIPVGSGHTLSYQLTCDGCEPSEVTSISNFTVVSKLPRPVLSVFDSSSSAVTTYYTTTGRVTVKASNTTIGTNIPSGTKLKYKIGSGTEQSTDPSTGFTLDIQGSAYSVTAWYECSDYESSATILKSYTVWLDKSKIVLTATSRSAHAEGTQTTTGSSPSLAHNFYGVTGSSFSFSAGDSTVKKANGSSYSFSTSVSTFTLEHNGSTSKTVYATLDGSKVSESVTFSASSTMRPITYNIYGRNLKISIWFNDGDYGTAGGNPDITGYADVGNAVNTTDATCIWAYDAAGDDWSLPNPTDEQTVSSTYCTDYENKIVASSPNDTVYLKAMIREEDTNEHVVMEQSYEPTVKDLYDANSQCKDYWIQNDKCALIFPVWRNQ